MISFNFGLGDINAVNYANRLAARRQTEEQRAQIRAKYRTCAVCLATAET